ncbi:MAG: trehalose-phosphatase [Candidatus Rokuibacteriota bacterium]
MKFFQTSIGPARPPGPAVVETLVVRVRAAPARLLLLDYDGTLVPFVENPALARPDDELLALLHSLASSVGTEVHVVSGRTRGALEGWLGALPIGLHAEHGLASRAPGTSAWVTRELPPSDWRPSVLGCMRRFTAWTPGALVEEKDAGLAWHYRAAEPALGDARARALELELASLLAGAPVSILLGAKVIEVLPRVVHKGSLVPALAAAAPPGALLVAIGDDRTDEDLFAALPVDGLAIHVGPGPTRAPIRLNGVADVRALLRDVADRPAG